MELIIARKNALETKFPFFILPPDPLKDLSTSISSFNFFSRNRVPLGPAVFHFFGSRRLSGPHRNDFELCRAQEQKTCQASSRKNAHYSSSFENKVGPRAIKSLSDFE
jgi:hypothetical protein